MTKMVVIADDITGALDTCVKFAAAGAAARVCIDANTDLLNAGRDEVLVLCVPSRHIPPEAAYELIRDLTRRAVEAGVPCIFKKTDSALRGNIGAEISGVLDGSGGKTICFVPALPAMGRVTRGGVQYIEGVPVAESVFGSDPYEPVRESDIPTLLSAQCSPGTLILAGDRAGADCPEGKSIRVFDCGSRGEMDAIVAKLDRFGSPRLLAGCAGLAESLAAAMGDAAGAEPLCGSPRRLLVVCGSINPITRTQMDHAERSGFVRRHLPGDALLEEDGLTGREGRALLGSLWREYESCPLYMLDTLELDPACLERWTRRLTPEGVRARISERVGDILKTLVDRGADARMILVGGDTLLAFMEKLGIRELAPVRELQPGVVLTRVTYRDRIYEVVSKSGGFGGEDLLTLLRENAGDASLGRRD